MTKIETIIKNASEKTFNRFKENAEMLAESFETTIHNREGGNKSFKAKDKCLSFHGDKPCLLFIVDDARTTYKLDCNTNTVQLILNIDD